VTLQAVVVALAKLDYPHQAATAAAVFKHT
jgi:hypothetical protein